MKRIDSLFIAFRSGFLSWKVYSLLGQEVRELASGQMNAGSYEVVWNAAGQASGVYFYRMYAGTFAETKKLNCSDSGGAARTAYYNRSLPLFSHKEKNRFPRRTVDTVPNLMVESAPR